MQKAQKRLIRQIGEAIEAEAKINAPVDKGRLRDDITTWYEGDDTVIIGNSVAIPYAPFVHQGTKPYIIKPKKKKALANKAKGQFFGKEVHHPGIKAQPYLVNAATEVLHGRKLDVIINSFADELGDELVKDIKKSFKGADIKVV